MLVVEKFRLRIVAMGLAHLLRLQFDSFSRRHVGQDGSSLRLLQCSQVSDDRPAVDHLNSVTIAEHGVLTVGDRVENLPVSHGANAILKQALHRIESKSLRNAVSRSGRAVTDCAINAKPLLATPHYRRGDLKGNARAPILAHLSSVDVGGRT